MEAVIAASMVIMIFFIVYHFSNYNLLSSLETKKDIEKFHKAELIKDYFIKKYSFPGEYEEDYLTFARTLPISERTFDPINNFTDKNIMFIIHPNSYDSMFNINPNLNLSNITVPNNFTIYSNVYVLYNPPKNIISGDKIYFNEMLYIPKITEKIVNNNSLKLYGCEGDRIYFNLDKKAVSTYAKALNNETAIFKVNGELYSKNLTTEFRKIDITPSLKNGVNKIEILKSPYPIEFEINTNESTTFYFVTLSPRNVTIIVGQ